MSNFGTRREYLSNLPKKRMSAACLVFNGSGSLLLVKPSYIKEWHLPGGVIEAMESPRIAADRELKEETGLSIKSQTLLCVDYKQILSQDDEAVLFLFDYGDITAEQSGNIHIDHQEIIDFGFFDVIGACSRVSDPMAKRIKNAILAKQSGTVRYLENAQIIFTVSASEVS
jgi:8-oxo-dGTP pyrophosphatase MutT (NUDIX family)